MSVSLEKEETNAESELIILAGRNLNEEQRKRFVQMHQEHRVVSPIILAHIVGIKPQVIYSYMRNDRLASHISETGHKVIAWDDAVEFIKNRLTKEAKKQEKIQAELRGEGN